MILGKPLFPGSSTLNQIERIMSTVDPPTREDIDSIESPYGASVLERASKKYVKAIAVVKLRLWQFSGFKMQIL